MHATTETSPDGKANFMPQMAAEAAAFAKKKGIDSNMFVMTPKATGFREQREIDFSVPATENVFIPQMAWQAEAIGKKKGIDFGLFASTPPPAEESFFPDMASEAAASGSKRPIDYGLFVTTPPSAQEDFIPHMASQAVAFGKKTAIDSGIFADSKLAYPSPDAKNIDVVSVPTTSIRGKDDFMPTPGQTALHPSQVYKLFVPEMATEAAAFVRKGAKNEAAAGPAAIYNEPPSEKEQDFLARQNYAQKIAAAREQAPVTTQKVVAGQTVPAI